MAVAIRLRGLGVDVVAHTSRDAAVATLQFVMYRSYVDHAAVGSGLGGDRSRSSEAVSLSVMTIGAPQYGHTRKTEAAVVMACVFSMTGLSDSS